MYRSARLREIEQNRAPENSDESSDENSDESEDEQAVDGDSDSDGGDDLPARRRSDKLPEDATVGTVETAINCWLALFKYLNALYASVENDLPGSQERKEYARNLGAAGRAWAEAMVTHSPTCCGWQYVHNAFAHEEADALEHGQKVARLCSNLSPSPDYR